MINLMKIINAYRAQRRLLNDGWGVMFIRTANGVKGFARRRTERNNLTVEKFGPSWEDVAIEMVDATDDAWQDLMAKEAEEATDGSS